MPPFPGRGPGGKGRNMKIKLSDHFTYRKLLRFTLPSVVMMVFTSLYSVVDGLFVANLVGDLALSAVNIVFPVAMIIGAFGFMLGTGGSAIVARTLGEKKKELADRYFSMFILCVAILGAALSVVCVILVAVSYTHLARLPPRRTACSSWRRESRRRWRPPP